MPELTVPKATICIVNYKTPDFTKLCLRSIRKFTNYPYQVIVIDNNSNDESLEYLKSLSWIKLIERKNTNDPSGGYAHGAALNLALENCDTEFFISLHSDTFIKKQNWLTDLINYFNNDQQIACVGSGKIEMTPKWRKLLKAATDFRTFKRKLLNTPDPLGKYRYYNRTICCIYRTDILKKEKLHFLMDREKGLTAGKKIYFDLVDKGYKTVELHPDIMKKYLTHLAHATQVVNPEEFKLRHRTIKKCNQLVDDIMASEFAQNILNNDLLDS